MPRQIRFQSRYPLPAAELYATLVDRRFLQAKLDGVGGTNAELVELEADAEQARIVLRQGISHEQLPTPFRAFLRTDLTIERTETWRRAGPGHYTGTVTARVKDAPGTIGGDLDLADVTGGGGGCDYTLDGSASVDLPLIGGRVEDAIAGHVRQLMELEAEFTHDWLTGGGSSG